MIANEQDNFKRAPLPSESLAACDRENDHKSDDVDHQADYARTASNAGEPLSVLRLLSLLHPVAALQDLLAAAASCCYTAASRMGRCQA